ncbi:MAG: c-type cytochrome [Thiomicrospira sp.]|jgi:cytochrome c2|nr:c-type cytochrome [Thiomicrospira sp.]
MKTLLTIVGLLILSLAYADEGEELYNKTCVACHTIGNGRLVGPDLINVSEHRSQEWLVAFIKSSQTLIKSGDPEAVAIYEEYNRMPMPDNDFTDAQTLAVINYIKRTSAGTESSAQTEVAQDMLSEATDENISSGAKLFSGEKRLTNGGAACNSCHNVQNAQTFSHGTLAKDLTASWEMMGSSGVAAIIKSPPFPLMTTAYHNQPVTEQETIDLTAYLKSVSVSSGDQSAESYDMAMAIFGVSAFFVIMLFIMIFYKQRKPSRVSV